MIFVTVGSGAVKGFDELIREVDRLKKENLIKDEVVCQIGNGSYTPRYCKWFRFENTLDQYFRKANLVITHSGAGTLFELMRLKKKVIAVANKDSVDNPDILIALAKKNHIFLCRPDLKDLQKLMTIKKSPTPYKSPQCTIDRHIKRFLKEAR